MIYIKLNCVGYIISEEGLCLSSSDSDQSALLRKLISTSNCFAVYTVVIQNQLLL